MSALTTTSVLPLTKAISTSPIRTRLVCPGQIIGPMSWNISLIECRQHAKSRTTVATPPCVKATNLVRGASSNHISLGRVVCNNVHVRMVTTAVVVGESAIVGIRGVLVSRRVVCARQVVILGGLELLVTPVQTASLVRTASTNVGVMRERCATRAQVIAPLVAPLDGRVTTARKNVTMETLALNAITNATVRLRMRCVRRHLAIVP